MFPGGRRRRAPSPFLASRPRAALALAWCVAAAAALASCAQPEGKDAARREQTLETADGWLLAVSVFPAAAEKAPGLLLVHGYGAGREVWEHFARRAQQDGYCCVAVDLRGHGGSRRADGTAPGYRSLGEAAWRNAAADLRAALGALLDAGADPDNLGVAGEGMGASLALLYAAEEPAMQAVVMVSPALDEHGLRPEPVIRRMRERPVLILAAEHDTPAHTAATVLKQAAAGFCELRIYPGSAYGADLFTVSENALLQVFGWLRAIIGPAPI